MNIADIARRAGLERSHVSRQIHGHRRMTPAVQQAIRELQREQEKAMEEEVAARFAARGLPEVAQLIINEYTR